MGRVVSCLSKKVLCQCKIEVVLIQRAVETHMPAGIGAVDWVAKPSMTLLTFVGRGRITERLPHELDCSMAALHYCRMLSGFEKQDQCTCSLRSRSH